jgi:hypothetical protein
MCRLLLSDGEKFHPYAMLATNKNQFVETEQLTKVCGRSSVHLFSPLVSRIR